MNRNFCFVILFSMIFLTSLYAGDLRGVYLGGGVGQSFIQTEFKDIQNTDLKLDESDFAFKFFAGTRMSRVLAFEAGYKHLGTVKDKFEGMSYESSTSGYDLCALGNLHLGIVDIFAKAGVFFWDITNKIESIEMTDSDSNLLWGFGATVRLGTLGIRAEWERFELEQFDRLSMLSAGITYNL